MPMAARVLQKTAQQYDPGNFVIMHTIEKFHGLSFALLRAVDRSCCFNL